MAGPSIAVLADDITGAAEIAAIGNRHGLPARIFAAGANNATVFHGLSVYDSDSRLLPADQAATRCAKISTSLAAARPAFVFKKTDSVLRGNVVAESVALARALGRRRILLAPANPALGRTISQGQYFIHGVLLHETAFARDPHHPAKSAHVVDLVASSPDWPVSVAAIGSTLPDHGIVIAEAVSSADVAHWASRLDEHTLAAGGAEFFQACLKQLGLSPQPTAFPNFTTPALIVTGALTPARETLLAHATASRWPLHTLSAATDALTRDLSAHGLAVTHSPKIALDDHATALRIRENFGQLVRHVLTHTALGHLVVEGGATAAAISDANGWTSFDVAGEWAPGVIALRPTQAPRLLFTIKPGSYAWPENLWRQLDSCLAPAAKS